MTTTWVDLWDAIQEAKDDEFVRPDQPFGFDEEHEQVGDEDKPGE